MRASQRPQLLARFVIGSLSLRNLKFADLARSHFSCPLACEYLLEEVCHWEDLVESAGFYRRGLCPELR
jgi:hypothetical protein